VNTHHNCNKAHPNTIANMQRDFTIWKNCWTSVEELCHNKNAISTFYPGSS
jgi:hypothetical protein